MKKLIEYYYGIAISEIRFVDDIYYLKAGEKSYIFRPIYDVTLFFNMYSFIVGLSNICNKIHSIVLTSDGEKVVFDNNAYYVLYRVNVSVNRVITLNDIVEFQILMGESSSVRWKDLWKIKLDEFENYVNSKNMSCWEFEYFIGMGELALNYLNSYVGGKRYAVVLSHRRINSKTTLYDLYDPINIIVDSSSRDIAEYVKSCFFSNRFIDDFEQIFMNSFFDEDFYKLFIARLLFPTCFFDAFEQNNLKEVYEMLTKMKMYDKFLKEIFREIKKRNFSIPEIPWLGV